MSAANLPLDRDAMRLLAEIGFVGTLSGPVGATTTLFQSLQLLRPDSILPLIGLALNDLAAKRPEDAVRILRDEALKQHPGDAEAMAFLGLALQKAGQNAEAHKVLMNVLQNRSRPGARPETERLTWRVSRCRHGSSSTVSRHRRP